MTITETINTRAAINRYSFLEIDDESSDRDSFAVLDTRSGNVVIISHPEDVKRLVRHGAEWFLRQPPSRGTSTMGNQMVVDAIQKITAKYQKVCTSQHMKNAMSLGQVIDMLLEIAEEIEQQ